MDDHERLLRMRSTRLRQVGLACAVVFGVLVLGAPHVAGDPYENLDPQTCGSYQYGLYESAEQPAEVNRSKPGVEHYRNLTAAQQALVDRGLATTGEEIEINQSTYRMALGGSFNVTDRYSENGIPHILLYDDGVYRQHVWPTDCPLIAGVPAAFNPVSRFFLTINQLVTGPLAPLLIVGGMVGILWAAGRKIQY